MNYNDLRVLSVFVMTWIIVLIIILLGGVIWYKLTSKKNTNTLKDISYLPALETQLKIINTSIVHIEFKGLLPNEKESKLKFVTTIQSKYRNESPKPVLSFIDVYQSEDSKNFENINELGSVPPHTGADEWQSFCNVPLLFLQTAHQGEQKLLVTSKLIDENGYVLDSFENTHQVNIPQNGYLEEGSDIVNARKSIIELAIATAFVDGEYHNNESELINNWILKTLQPYQSKQKITLEKELYGALNAAEKTAESVKIDSDKLLEEIKNTNNSLLSYEALELIIDVMTADGVENTSETKFINSIANKLFIDREELNRIKNQKISKLATPLRKGRN